MHRTGLVELEAVLAVARLKGFRPAAAELGMSTSALSSAIAGLEARLKVRLFNRTTRSVSLTDAGLAFVHRVQPAVAEIGLAMTEANSQAGRPAGILRINSSLGAARMVLAPLILAYLERYPEVSVNLVTEARYIDIVAGGYDVGVRLADTVPMDMIRIPIGGPIRMAVVGSPDYFTRFPIPQTLADLVSQQCIRIRSPNGAPYAWEFMGQGESIQIDVPGQLVVDAPALMHDAARRGWGLAYLAEWYVNEDLEAGRLMRVLEACTPAYGRLALYYPAGRHIPAALRAFIDLSQELMPASTPALAPVS
jgi:DNA-binding transcriptional LysR family regulator